MVLIFTGNEQLDIDLSKNIEDSRIVYYPDYILQEKEAQILIVSVQPNKFNFKEFLFKVRQKNIRIILLLENDTQEELKDALLLGIYDIIFDTFSIDEVKEKIITPSKFSNISKYILPLLKAERSDL